MTHRTLSPQRPLIVEPAFAGQSLEDAAATQRDAWDGALTEHHAILFRGFAVRDGLSSVAAAFFEELLTYTYRSTPRSNLGQYVYTATEYPRQLTIPQHNENAYQLSWPMRLLFHCVTPAARGGRTPLASTAAVTAAIDPAVREEFERRKVMYVRNYRAGVDLPWEEVFGTDSRAMVEAFCAQRRIRCEWRKDGLRTSQVCQAMACHPVTGEKLWFNQAHLFHLSAQERETRDMLLAFFGEDGLPRQAYFGDGGAIAEDMLEHVRRAYETNLFSFAWEADDVLLIDNMLVTHGREPFEGERKVLVCMARERSPHGLEVDDAVGEADAEMVKLYV